MMSNTENFLVNRPLQYKIKVTKFHSAAVNDLATGAFQKCNWGQFEPMVDRGLNISKTGVKCSGYIPTTFPL